MDENLIETGFTTPENYFSELTNNIQARVLSERISAVAPNDGYTVPDGYFEQLRMNIELRTLKERKVIRLWRSSLLKYASAACFILLSAVGFYFYELQQPDKKIVYRDFATEQLLYDIDEQIIIDHIEANDLQQINPAVTEGALENYILNNYTQTDIASGL
ncbi:hypothetical protein [Pedobacter heparinus]|uniref:hypothetical protein n=1 Tax=Pedobacter heparinus TaxID=984 RepID=UPI00292EABDB|nr:hypothetical protein [Pedobacter heparinus]